MFDTLNHLPEFYKYRDSQISEILRGIRPGLKNEKLESKLIIGEPSTGKTTAIKKVFQTIDENIHRIKTVYINCNIYSTIYEIYKKIVLSLDKSLFKTRMDKNILFDIIIDYLTKNNVSLLVCLDDVYRFESI